MEAVRVIAAGYVPWLSPPPRPMFPGYHPYQVRVIAAGYPDRVPHTEVIARFGSLVTGQERPAAEQMGEKAAAVRTLQLLGL